MQPRIKMSEPAHRAPTTAWQRERMGGLKAMNSAYALTGWKQAVAACMIVFAIVVIGISI